MTKWARIRRRKERRRVESEERQKAEPSVQDPYIQQEKIIENVEEAKPTKKIKHTQIQTSKPIISQIPRYVYLVAFFALLSGVFFPLITDNPMEQNFDNVIKGTGILFLGLVGGILVFKAATSNKKQSVLMGCGFALIAISLALIFTIASVPGT